MKDGVSAVESSERTNSPPMESAARARDSRAQPGSRAVRESGQGAPGLAGRGGNQQATAERLSPSHRVEFAPGMRATGLDAERGFLELSGGGGEGGPGRREIVKFERCLLSIGSQPKPPPTGFVDPAALKDVALLGWKDEGVRHELREAVAAGKVRGALAFLTPEATTRSIARVVES